MIYVRQPLSIPLLQVGLTLRLVAVVLPLIEPFTDAIGNHLKW